MSLEVGVDARSFERIPADLAIAGFFRDERPLRGAAGRVDWRLCGLPSDLLRADRIRGEARDALLLPSGGRLAAERVLLLGLGSSEEYDAERARRLTADAIGRGLDLGARSIALSPLGITADGFARHANWILEGALAVLEPRAAHACLRLAVTPEYAGRGTRALEGAAARRPGAVAVLSAVGLPDDAEGSPAGRRRAAFPTPVHHAPPRS